MTDRPTTPPPGDPQPERPGQGPEDGTPPTAALPPGAAAAGPDPAQTAPPPPSAGPQAPAWGAPGPQGPGGAWTGATAAAAPRTATGPRRLWSEATSTGGGRAALAAVAVLGTLLLVTGIGLLAALLSDDDGWGRDERVGMSDGRGPWGDGVGPGQGLGQGKRNGNGMGNGMGDRGQRDLDDAPGLGLGRGGALAGAGDVLHGEFTTGVTGTPTVMVVQTGTVTAYTAGESIAVESADGFRATYSLDGTIGTPRSLPVATGSQVRVVAAKSGMTVTRLVVLD